MLMIFASLKDCLRFISENLFSEYLFYVIHAPVERTFPFLCAIKACKVLIFVVRGLGLGSYIRLSPGNTDERRELMGPGCSLYIILWMNDA